MKDIQATALKREYPPVTTSPNQSCGNGSEAGQAWNFLARSDQVGSGSEIIQTCRKNYLSLTHFLRKLRKNFKLQHYYTPELIL